VGGRRGRKDKKSGRKRPRAKDLDAEEQGLDDLNSVQV